MHWIHAPKPFELTDVIATFEELIYILLRMLSASHLSSLIIFILMKVTRTNLFSVSCACLYYL